MTMISAYLRAEETDRSVPQPCCSRWGGYNLGAPAAESADVAEIEALAAEREAAKLFDTQELISDLSVGALEEQEAIDAILTE